MSGIRPQTHKTHKTSARGARERRREARLLLPRSGKACGRERGGGSTGGGGAGAGLGVPGAVRYLPWNQSLQASHSIMKRVTS